ncbi:hypothetical protein Tco_0663977 [Tanacetum coccineum]
MAPETVQAMIDQALQRNSTNTHDDGKPKYWVRTWKAHATCNEFVPTTDFIKYQPLNFKGTEGVVGLSRWFEKMELVFHISGYAIDNQVKFTTYTLLGAALTWWNSHKVDKYISGLPDNIHGNVMSARPKTLDDANRGWPNDLRIRNIRTNEERQAKCYSDEPLAILLDGLRIDDKLHIVDEPVEVIGREIKQLKRSRIPIFKVRWNSKRGPEFTWERKDQFKQKCPHLFTKTAPSSSVAS